MLLNNSFFIEIDHCFENDQCGTHGVCHNDGIAFHCECTFLYDGLFCNTCMYYKKMIFIKIFFVL